MKAYRPPSRIRDVLKGLDPASTSTLSDLSKLYVCREWARADLDFLQRDTSRSIHLVVDADVAVNWAVPGERGSLIRVFDSEALASTLSTAVGHWLFFAQHTASPETRIYERHAHEIARESGAENANELRQIGEHRNRIEFRDRPLTEREREEITRYIADSERKSGFSIQATVDELKLVGAPGSASHTKKQRLARLLASPTLKPVSLAWIRDLLDGQTIDTREVKDATIDWETALGGGTGEPERSDPNTTDATAIAYVETLERALRLRSRPHRVVFLTGSARLYRAAQTMRSVSHGSQFMLRHPLCFLFADYGLLASSGIEFGESDQWTAFSHVFQMFLKGLTRDVHMDADGVFGVAHYLAWMSQPDGHVEGRNQTSHAADASGLVSELMSLRTTGLELAIGRSLRMRTEQEVQERLAIQKSLKVNQASATQIAGLPRPSELELLAMLGLLERTAIDTLLKQLVDGVLAYSLPPLDGQRLRTSPSWRKVPILKFDNKVPAIQDFAIDLRIRRIEEVLTTETLQRVRELAAENDTYYLALVIDALILAAFGEWPAAAKMAERAVYRAEYFLERSESRNYFDQLPRTTEGKDIHDALVEDAKIIDGREARYICAHATRYSAGSLYDFERAAKHLRAFRKVAQPDDRRVDAEDLALALSEWSYLRYEKGQENFGRLDSIRRRLENLVMCASDELQAACDSSRVDKALKKYVWEQTALNLAVTLIESSALHESRLGWTYPVPELVENLRSWSHGEQSHASRFARFITAVAAVVLDPAGILTRSVYDKDIEDYSSHLPPTLNSYERARTFAFTRLVREATTKAASAR